MYDYNKLFDFACDKFYYVKTRDDYEYSGLLMNYYGGNIVMFTKNGIVHEQYRNIDVMRPTKKVSSELQEILEKVKKNND